MTVLGQIWPFFLPKILFLREGVKLLVPSYQETNKTPFPCWKHWPIRLKLAARDEKRQFWPENLDIWGQKLIFCFGIAIFVIRAYHQNAWGYNFHIRTTRISVSVLRFIFWFAFCSDIGTQTLFLPIPLSYHWCSTANLMISIYNGEMVSNRLLSNG